MPVSDVTWTFVDYANVTGTVTVHGQPLSAANFATQGTLRAALLSAIQGIVGGVLRVETVIASRQKFDDPKPTDPQVWKSKRWNVSMLDTNGNNVGFHIVTAMPDAAYLVAGTNVLDLTSTEGAAFQSAVEAFARSNDNEAATLQQVTFVDK